MKEPYNQISKLNLMNFESENLGILFTFMFVHSVNATRYCCKHSLCCFSYNNIETLKGLENFTRLEELILDNNKLGDSVKFPHLPKLKTLSINNNQVCFVYL